MSPSILPRAAASKIAIPKAFAWKSVIQKAFKAFKRLLQYEIAFYKALEAWKLLTEVENCPI